MLRPKCLSETLKWNLSNLSFASLPSSSITTVTSNLYMNIMMIGLYVKLYKSFLYLHHSTAIYLLPKAWEPIRWHSKMRGSALEIKFSFGSDVNFAYL